MGFKYQLLSCSFPQEMLLVTLNHLYQLRSKVEEAPAVTELVDEVVSQVKTKYSALSSSEFAALKQARKIPCDAIPVLGNSGANLSIPMVARHSAVFSSTKK